MQCYIICISNFNSGFDNLGLIAIENEICVFINQLVRVTLNDL